MKTCFLFKFWLLKSFFRITSLQIIKLKLFFNWQLLLTSMFMGIHAVWQLDIIQNWNRKSSSLYWYMQPQLYFNLRRNVKLWYSLFTLKDIEDVLSRDPPFIKWYIRFIKVPYYTFVRSRKTMIALFFYLTEN